MSTEHLLREFYNEMYRVHTQPGNAYDIGDHLYHLTVHKQLDQDPLIQFREAFRAHDFENVGRFGHGVLRLGRSATILCEPTCRIQRRGHDYQAAKGAPHRWAVQRVGQEFAHGVFNVHLH
jgi:hypothetical protein